MPAQDRTRHDWKSPALSFITSFVLLILVLVRSAAIGLARAVFPAQARREVGDGGVARLLAWYMVELRMEILRILVDWSKAVERRIVEEYRRLIPRALGLPGSSLPVAGFWGWQSYPDRNHPWCEPAPRPLGPSMSRRRTSAHWKPLSPLQGGEKIASIGSGIPYIIFDFLVELEADNWPRSHYPDTTTPSQPSSYYREHPLLAFGLVCREWCLIYRRWRFRDLKFSLSGRERHHMIDLIRENTLVASSIRRLELVGGLPRAPRLSARGRRAARASSWPRDNPGIKEPLAPPRFSTRESRRKILILPLLDALIPHAVNLDTLDLVLQSLRATARVNQRLHTHILSLPHLTSFSLSLNTLYDPEDQTTFHNYSHPSATSTITSILAAMCSLRDLKSLRLEGTAVDPLELPKHTFPQFHLHHLHATFPLTDADLEWLTASSTGSLHSCVLYNPPGITPLGLQNLLSRHGSTLKSLAFSQWGAPQPFDSALQGLAESNLRWLGLGGSFTPQVLDTLAPQLVSTLKRLEISGLEDRITAADLLRFLRKADALEELDWWCDERDIRVLPDPDDPEREDWVIIHETFRDRGIWVNGQKGMPVWDLTNGRDETSELFTSGLSSIQL